MQSCLWVCTYTGEESIKSVYGCIVLVLWHINHKRLFNAKSYIYIYIIIIIMSRRLRGYPWPSLAISPYHSSPPAGLQDYNPCPHIAAVCKFVLVVPLLHIHEWGSTGVHRLWARWVGNKTQPKSCFFFFYTLPHGGWALWRRNCRPPLT